MNLECWSVEPEWKGETVALLGGGPSLTTGDVELLDRFRNSALTPLEAQPLTGLSTQHSKLRVIAINNAYQLAPWADLLYFCDQVWWIWHHGGLEIRQQRAIATPMRHPGDLRYREFGGIKAALENACTHATEPAVRVLRNYGDGPGLCPLPDGIYTGRSSGYQALNLAAHLGAARVLLIGYDMQPDASGRTHWHSGTPDAHRRPTAPQDFPRTMLPPWNAKLVADCAERGIEVLNCTPGSAITCFPMAELSEVLGTVHRSPFTVHAP